MNPGISVVIPTYNNAAYLGGAIESVRAQEWKDLEIIVVDDGSTDNTGEVLTTLAGSDLRVLVQENQGPAAARNNGIEISRGRWIAFLDADDLWLPGKLAAQVPALEKDAACGFSFGDSVFRDENGNESVRKPQIIDGDVFGGLMAGPQFLIDTVMVRRDCFEKYGGFDPALHTGEDWDLWLRLSSAVSGVYIPQALCIYREPVRAGKYPVRMLQICTGRILEKMFSNREMLKSRPGLLERRRRLYAWHYSVLAKSFWHQAEILSFVRFALKAVASHPIAFYFLGYRWFRGSASPDLIGPPKSSREKV